MLNSLEEMEGKPNDAGRFTPGARNESGWGWVFEEVGIPFDMWKFWLTGLYK